MRTLTAFFFLSTVLYGQGELIRDRLVHDQMRRSYSLYVPSTHSVETASPLVLNLVEDYPIAPILQIQLYSVCWVSVKPQSKRRKNINSTILI